jgi:hypothetical protein
MDIVNWPHTFVSNYLGPQAQMLSVWIFMCLLMRWGKGGMVFRVYNTLFHELGHAVMSLATSGNVHRIELFSNAGGVAVTSNKTWISRFLVSMAGYPFAAITGWLMLTQTNLLSEKYLAYSILGIYILSLVLWVRNKYGIVWLIVNSALVGAAIYFKQEHWANVYFFVVGSFILIESIWSCLVLLYIAAESPQEAGDAQNLRELTFLPSIIWALVFLAASLYFLNLTLGTLIGWRVI